ncbi:MAG: redoxin domain-containing protein, partial [Acidimicrobiales bacterium]
MRYPAPPLEGHSWLNGDPVDLGALRGRVVILLFWSHGCEASLIRMREVIRLVDENQPAVAAIGIHTPRFGYEHGVAPLRSVMAERRITVPVLHDPDAATWNRYNPDGWPATVVIDGHGRTIGMHAGLGEPGILTDAVALGVSELDLGRLDTDPHAPGRLVAPEPMPDTPLAFPNGVALTADGSLVVADTGHDRILVLALDDAGRRAVPRIEVTGIPQPVSVAAEGDERVLAVGRTGELIELDLIGRTRRSLLSDLIAPTSVVFDVDGSIVVADAGRDQIYRLRGDVDDRLTVGVIAGSGVTGHRDGSAEASSLAQPCGLARTEAGLVFCDAASSNVRLLTDRGRVASITGNDEFRYGMADGPAHAAVLQRPSDLVVLDDGSIIIVDTGNNRLRRLANRRIKTLGASGLDRPMGACGLPDGRIVVADTGGHQLVMVDASLQQAWPIKLIGVPRPAPPAAVLAGPLRP